MKVLITGADGFIGAHITRMLLASGVQTGALVIPGKALRRIADLPITFLQASLTDKNKLREVVTAWPPDACLHLAWYVEPGKYLTSSDNLTLLHSSFDLMQILAEAGCKHIITAGTCAEYDTDRGWLKEDGPTRPETLYAATKLSLCLLGEQLARSLGMTFAHARIFYPYGPGEDPRRMIPALIRALIADQPFPASMGEQVRDYIYVEDIALAFIMLIEANASGIYNIGSGEPIAICRLMQNVSEVVGCRRAIQFGALPPRDWEPPFICADVQKLHQLGWTPHYSLHEGLRITAQWWRDHNGNA